MINEILNLHTYNVLIYYVFIFGNTFVSTYMSYCTYVNYLTPAGKRKRMGIVRQVIFRNERFFVMIWHFSIKISLE